MISTESKKSHEFLARMDEENMLLETFREARKQWLDELHYTEQDIYRDEENMQYVWVDGWKVLVPKELRDIRSFIKKVRSHE